MCRAGNLSARALLEFVYDGFGIGIASAEFACEPIATTRCDGLAVREYVELAGFAGGTNGFDSEATFDEGRETRDLGNVVVSGGAVNDFDFHVGLRSDKKSIQPPEP